MKFFFKLYFCLKYIQKLLKKSKLHSVVMFKGVLRPHAVQNALIYFNILGCSKDFVTPSDHCARIDNKLHCKNELAILARISKQQAEM